MHCVFLTSYFFFEKDSFIQKVKEYYCKQESVLEWVADFTKEFGKLTKIIPWRSTYKPYSIIVKGHLAVGTQKEWFAISDIGKWQMCSRK